MRNPLNKRLPREFAKHASKYIGIFTILVCTILIGSSFLATMDSVTYTIQQNDEECRIEDGQFESLSPIPGPLKTYFEEEEIEALLYSPEIFHEYVEEIYEFGFA